MDRLVTTSKQITSISDLHQSLQGRHTPENVASMILSVYTPDDLGRQSYDILQGVSRRYSFSYMQTTFQRPTSLVKITNTLSDILGIQRITEEAASDVNKLFELLHVARSRIGAVPWHTDYMNDRLNRISRRSQGGELSRMSRRQYNRLFRIISRLERETSDLERQTKVFELGRFAKTGFASDISLDLFSKDTKTAAFVAYYTANLGRRSAFTIGKQARAYDEVADLLYRVATGYDNVCWEAIAMVYPKHEVLYNSDRSFIVDMLMRTYHIMKMSAILLSDIYDKSKINRETMIVSRGTDSSTWNGLAGAWNRARDYWTALIVSAGLESTFDYFMPGKVMRLMAGDVAYWHRYIGGSLDPDTIIHAALPPPWDVMTGQVSCTRGLIEQVCESNGIDPVETGWSYPRSRTLVDKWVPTPELVHGVTVNHPEFAHWMRKIGVFSGKPLRQGQIAKLREEFEDVD